MEHIYTQIDQRVATASTEQHTYYVSSNAALPSPDKLDSNSSSSLFFISFLYLFISLANYSVLRGKCVAFICGSQASRTTRWKPTNLMTDDNFVYYMIIQFLFCLSFSFAEDTQLVKRATNDDEEWKEKEKKHPSYAKTKAKNKGYTLHTVHIETLNQNIHKLKWKFICRRNVWIDEKKPERERVGERSRRANEWFRL